MAEGELKVNKKSCSNLAGGELEGDLVAKRLPESVHAVVEPLHQSKAIAKSKG